MEFSFYACMPLLADLVVLQTYCVLEFGIRVWAFAPEYLFTGIPMLNLHLPCQAYPFEATLNPSWFAGADVGRLGQNKQTSHEQTCANREKVLYPNQTILLSRTATPKMEPSWMS